MVFGALQETGIFGKERDHPTVKKTLQFFFAVYVVVGAVAEFFHPYYVGEIDIELIYVLPTLGAFIAILIGLILVPLVRSKDIIGITLCECVCVLVRGHR